MSIALAGRDGAEVAGELGCFFLEVSGHSAIYNGANASVVSGSGSLGANEVEENVDSRR